VLIIRRSNCAIQHLVSSHSVKWPSGAPDDHLHLCIKLVNNQNYTEMLGQPNIKNKRLCSVNCNRWHCDLINGLGNVIILF